MTREEKYRERKAANEASLAGAEHYREQWSEEEIALLEGCWGDVELSEIAEALGRTIEACRQAHYAIGRAMAKRAEKEREKAQKATRSAGLWERGFTSLEAMGY